MSQRGKNRKENVFFLQKQTFFLNIFKEKLREIVLFGFGYVPRCGWQP